MLTIQCFRDLLWWVLRAVSIIGLLLWNLSFCTLNFELFLKLLDLDVVSDIFFCDGVLHYITKIFLNAFHQHLHWTVLLREILPARFAFCTTEEACKCIDRRLAWSWLHIGASLLRRLIILLIVSYLVSLFLWFSAFGSRWEIDQFFHFCPLLTKFYFFLKYNNYF